MKEKKRNETNYAKKQQHQRRVISIEKLVIAHSIGRNDFRLE